LLTKLNLSACSRTGRQTKVCRYTNKARLRGLGILEVMSADFLAGIWDCGASELGKKSRLPQFREERGSRDAPAAPLRYNCAHRHQ
jgi:hypothetical protein